MQGTWGHRWITNPSKTRCALLSLAALAALLLAAPAWAQFNLPGLGGASDSDKPQVKVSAAIAAPSDGKPATLQITAEMLDGFHIGSLTQKPGGPVATKIKLDESPAYKLAGAFQPDHAPKVRYEQKIWPNLPLEEHHGKVTWSAPLELASGVDLKTLKISGKLDTQACKNICVQLNLPFTAELGAGSPVASPAAADVFTGEYRAEQSSVAIRGHVDPATVKPGGVARLVLTAVPDDTWHVYALEDRDPNVIGKGKPTLIVMENTSGLKHRIAPIDAKVIEKQSPLEGVGVEKYHEGEVSWTVELKIPADAKAGEYAVSGLIAYQTCYEKGCQQPLAAHFVGNVQVGSEEQSGQAPLAFTKSKYRVVSKLAEARPESGDAVAAAPISDADETSLLGMIFFGFAGGIILNLMPCVLPVIGLKVMSFVQQSGQSRSEVLRLNIWYSLGLMSVFLVLAGMAVFAGMAWGEQFGSDMFNIALAALVFAMALSLLGVWEIPIPGFVGGSKAHDLTEKEGPAGAFLKGVLTTVLATPCTGPFMGTALGWAVLQPAGVTFTVFGSIGLGMASPYLVIGAFPSLIRFLPKPGAWMVTFKQIMGFILIGTVVFLLTFIHPTLIVPTVTLLTGIGAACWWISRTTLTASLGSKLRAWGEGCAFAAAIGYVAFGWLGSVMEYRFNRIVNVAIAESGGEIKIEVAEHELPWQPFTRSKLDQLKQQHKTVLVDFTADWCQTCKERELNVLNTTDVKQVVTENGVITLQADFTKRPPEIKEMLTQLKSAGVPVVAIFPAGRPEEPIVFRGWYSKDELLAALEKAGPSLGDAVADASSMTVR